MLPTNAKVCELPLHTQLARRLADNGRFRWMRRLGYWWLRPSKAAWEAAFEAAFALEYPKERKFFGMSPGDTSGDILATKIRRDSYFRHKTVIQRNWWALRPSGVFDSPVEQEALMAVIGLKHGYPDRRFDTGCVHVAKLELAHAGQELHMLYRSVEHSINNLKPHW